MYMQYTFLEIVCGLLLFIFIMAVGFMVGRLLTQMQERLFNRLGENFRGSKISLH